MSVDHQSIGRFSRNGLHFGNWELTADDQSTVIQLHACVSYFTAEKRFSCSCRLDASSKLAKYSASSSSCATTFNICWFLYIDLSEILNRNSGGQLELSPDCHFVFGGDVVDRGPGDLRVLSDLANLRRSYPDRVHFIMGNRDINKMRIPIELHPSIIKIPPKVFWLKENELCAADSALVQTPAEKLKWVSESLSFV